jgi:hypothetical protein
MKLHCHERAAPASSRDRRIIRVELPPPHAEVAAALQRAFAAVPRPDETDFDRLLRRLA